MLFSTRLSIACTTPGSPGYLRSSKINSRLSKEVSFSLCPVCSPFIKTHLCSPPAPLAKHTPLYPSAFQTARAYRLSLFFFVHRFLESFTTQQGSFSHCSSSWPMSRAYFFHCALTHTHTGTNLSVASRTASPLAGRSGTLSGRCY